MFNLSSQFKKTWFFILISGYAVFALLIWQIPDNNLHIHFLDVGQGEGVFIKTPQNHKILIDGGPQDKIIEELSEILPFFDRNIDLIILTHPHADHVDGLVEVLKRYNVDFVLWTGVDYSSRTYEEFLKTISELEIQIFIADKETNFLFGDVIFDLIFPFEQMISEKVRNLNNSSVALRLIYKDKIILFTGDLEKEMEYKLAESYKDYLKADILHAGHHGSKTSSTQVFLDQVKPEIIVIQSEKGNRHGHPHEEVLERLENMGIKILRNDIHGRVKFTF